MHKNKNKYFFIAVLKLVGTEVPTYLICIDFSNEEGR